MEAANLPIHLPTREFMEETVREAMADKKKSKVAASKGSTPSKRRRKRSPVDIKKGIVISNAAAQALNKAGVPWVHNPAQPNGAPIAQMAQAGGGANVTGTTAFPSQAQPPPDRASTASTGAPTAASRPSTVTASPYISISNTTSELSSLEDTNDETYVPNGKRKAMGLGSAKKRSKSED